MNVRPPQRRARLNLVRSVSRSRVSPRLVTTTGLGEAGLRGRVSPGLAAARGARRGMTLTELLVVIMIMAFLLGAALPTMRTALEDRAMREGSRQLNTYVQMAKSVAAETGRPSALWIDTQWNRDDPTDPKPYAFQLFLAETPRPYAGDVVNARALVQLNTAQGHTATFDAASASLPLLEIRQGDTIRFDYKGPYYTITSVPPVGSVPPFAISFIGSPLPPDGVQVPYQILRQPIKSSNTPLELSNGAVIDLLASGFGVNGLFHNPNSVDPTQGWIIKDPLRIVFSPNGEITQVLGIVNQSTLLPQNPAPEQFALSTLHLLIGRPESLGAENLQDFANRWVSLGSQSGSVTTSENAWDGTLAGAREFAQKAQGMGGR